MKPKKTDCAELTLSERVAELERQMALLLVPKPRKRVRATWSEAKMSHVRQIQAVAWPLMTLRRGAWTASELARRWDIESDRATLVSIGILCRDVWKLTCRRSGGDRLWVFDGRAL